MLHAVIPARNMPPARLALVRSVAIGLIGFLTLVDLFAAQAILPSLVRAYGVSPAAMGLAVNASTLGMAAAGWAATVAGIAFALGLAGRLAESLAAPAAGTSGGA